jgi:AdoMet-dependent rRNA methyltransferase SPB1
LRKAGPLTPPPPSQARFSDATDAPIKKVAEARARKRKRAAKLLDVAKRKAAAVAEEPDMSSRSKMRQIEKLYRGAEVKRPGAVYVVAGKNGSKTAVGKTKGKRVKIVDKREKKDKRGLKRAAAKKKGGRK